MKNVIDADLIMPRRRDLPTQIEGDCFVIVDPEIGGVYFLNPAAAVVWTCCDGVSTLGQCSERIQETFLTPPFADVPRMILGLLDVLIDLKLVNSRSECLNH